jgi:ribosome-associated protein
VADDLIIDLRTVISGRDLSWTAVRASGPGGQNVNRVASKVDLRFDIDGCEALRDPVKQRLRRLAWARVDAEGRIVITCQVTRNQSRNLELARQHLAELIRKAMKPPKPRKATKPSRAAKQRRLSEKRKLGEKKAGRVKLRS